MPSFVERQAAFLGLPLINAMHRFGLVDDERVNGIENGYGIFVSPERLADFARINHLTEGNVREMLLMRYHGICLDLESGANQRGSWQQVALREWAYFSGSHVCPECIRESDGAWQIAWKLPWSFACLEHRASLVGTCLECHARPASWRTDGITRPNFLRLIPVPGTCANAVPANGSRGRGSHPCGHDFRTDQARRLRFTKSLDAQVWINTALREGRGVVAGRELQVQEFFAVLRGICSLWLYAGTRELLISVLGRGVPPALLSAVEEHCLERERAEAERNEAVKSGSSNSRRPKAKVAGRAPSSSALMAALATSAHQYASAENPHEMAERMRDLFELARERAGGRRNLVSFLTLPPLLEQGYDQLFKDGLSFHRRLGSGSTGLAASDQRQYSFLPEHVSQVLWEHEYEMRFASVLAGSTLDDLHARSVISMMLVKLATGCTWDDSARLLDLPLSRATGSANKLVGIVRKSPLEGEFKRHLHELAGELSESHNRVNYGARRTALERYYEIPWCEWLVIAEKAGVDPGRSGVRNRHAAVWVWALATQGDFRLCLGRLPGNRASNFEVHRRFRRGCLPRVRPYLESLARELVSSTAGA